MPEQDYYEVLGLAPGAGNEAVQSAYRSLCKQYHPDTGRPAASVAMMARINEAYAVLSDPARRREYDSTRPRRGARRSQDPVTLRPGDLTLELGPGLMLPLAHVPAGEFLMGGCAVTAYACDGQGVRDKAYRYFLPDYYMGIYPVTVAQYAAFAAATRRRRTPWASRSFSFDPTGLQSPEMITRLDRNWQHPFGGSSTVAGKEQHPVVIVTWFDAVAFCRWASEMTGASVRLPTAAEWQKAARGPEGRCYPWGDSPAPGPRFCNGALAGPGRGVTDTTPVGAFSPLGDSPYGCSDMLGNVWEWTSTRSRDGSGRVFGAPYRPDDGREDPAARDARLLMGGSYEDVYATLCCSIVRDQDPIRPSDTGFRVCVSRTP